MSTHKWCDIYQESVVAARNYFRRVLFVFIILVGYQSYMLGMPWWASVFGGLMTWGLVRFGGRIAEDRHYHAAEAEWEEEHGTDSVVIHQSSDDSSGSQSEDRQG